MKTHLTKKPSKALTLSFHGGCGTGKTYVSRIIAENLYKQGLRNKYVHFINAVTEFPHKKMLSVYKVIFLETVSNYKCLLLIRQCVWKSQCSVAVYNNQNHPAFSSSCIVKYLYTKQTLEKNIFYLFKISQCNWTFISGKA